MLLEIFQGKHGKSRARILQALLLLSGICLIIFAGTLYEVLTGKIFTALGIWNNMLYQAYGWINLMLISLWLYILADIFLNFKPRVQVKEIPAETEPLYQWDYMVSYGQTFTGIDLGTYRMETMMTQAQVIRHLRDCEQMDLSPDNWKMIQHQEAVKQIGGEAKKIVQLALTEANRRKRRQQPRPKPQSDPEPAAKIHPLSPPAFS